MTYPPPLLPEILLGISFLSGSIPHPEGSARSGFLQTMFGSLSSLLRRISTPARVVVTYREGGNEVSKYSSDFLGGARPDELRYLRLIIQEPEAYGINRNVTVELNANGTNEVRTQGVQESWVVGKAETVKSWLRQRQKTIITTARHSGASVFNTLLFLSALAALRTSIHGGDESHS